MNTFITNMLHLLVAVRIDRVRPEVAVQHLLVRMQYQPKIAAQRLKSHLLDHVEGMTAWLGASFHHRVLDIFVRMQHFVVDEIFVQLT